MKKTFLILIGTLLVAGSAYAEYFEGTIANIDREGKKMTLSQKNTGELIEIKVNGVTALDLLRAGSPVRVQADKKDMIHWSASSVQVPREQLNVPDESLLESAEQSSMASVSGVAANESFSAHAIPADHSGGTEVNVRAR